MKWMTQFSYVRYVPVPVRSGYDVRRTYWYGWHTWTSDAWYPPTYLLLVPVQYRQELPVSTGIRSFYVPKFVVTMKTVSTIWSAYVSELYVGELCLCTQLGISVVSNTIHTGIRNIRLNQTQFFARAHALTPYQSRPSLSERTEKRARIDEYRTSLATPHYGQAQTWLWR
jgi:hypothetical protein